MEYFDDLYWFEENHCHENGDEYHIQEYVGIQDKNGRDVYEGDIVKYPAYGQTYSKKTSIFYRRPKPIWLDTMLVTAHGLDAVSMCYGGIGFPITEHDVNLLEVIGNIYEDYVR
jgi:uncharacterized phage protein (TIGR01671 family)